MTENSPEQVSIWSQTDYTNYIAPTQNENKMSRQPFHCQLPQTLSLPDPFVYHDYSFPWHGYWGSYWEDMPMDEELDVQPSDMGKSNEMSDYVEYGDDYIDAGPTSFPVDEYVPSREEMLHAQKMAQTVCPAELVLSHSPSVDTIDAQVGVFPSTGVKFPVQDTAMDITFNVDDTMQLDIGK